MPPVADPISEILEGCVECLDTHSEIVALTGRPNANVVPVEDMTDGRGDGLPIIGYALETSGPGRGAFGDWRRATIRFEAEAQNRRRVGELLNAVRKNLTAVNLFANTNHPLDAFIVRSPDAETRFGFLASEEDPDAIRSSIQITLEAAFE